MSCIAIVAAMPEERSALVKRLAGVRRTVVEGFAVYSGRLGEREVCVVESGMGTAAAARATKALIGAVAPTLLMSAGFCGAVRPGPQTGDLVVCRRLLTADSERVQELPLPGGEQAALRLSAELQRFGLRAWQGSFITSRVILTKSALSARLPEDMAHPVLEMESAAVALAAAGAGIPFVGLRAVSDDSSEELQFSLDDVCGDDGQVSVLRVMGLLVRRPRLLAQFLRLASGSAKAGKSLGQSLERIGGML